MAENRTEVLVGAAVLVVAIGFLAFAAKATGFSAGGATYDLRASFRSAEGVTVGTDIRMVGVKVGTVTGLGLNQETFRADATLSFKDQIPVPNDSTAIVASEGLLGGNFVEILPGSSFDNYAAGDEILDTQGSVSLIDLLVKFASGSGGNNTGPASDGASQ